MGQNISIKPNIIESSIIGHWEIDYKNLRDCDEGKKIKHVKGKESSFDFYNNGNYRRLIWGFESGGTYTLNQSELILNEKYQLEDENSKEQKRKLGIEKLLGDTLIISFTECDTKIQHIYFRKKISQIGWNEIKQYVAQITKSTTYKEIILKLGKPYKEFVTPTLLEEYVLYYDISDEPEFMYWIMLDTKTKRFLYWSTEKLKRS